MQLIQPNNKAISEERRAELKGEYNEAVIYGRLIIEGYEALKPYEQGFILRKLGKEKDIPLDLISDADVLSYCKQIKIQYFKTTCEEIIELGFTATNGHYYRTDRDDQINMIGQKDSLAADESIQNVPWKTEDVGYINHTREEWLTVYNEAFSHKKTQLFKYDSLKGQVLAATTHAAVAAILW